MQNTWPTEGIQHWIIDIIAQKHMIVKELIILIAFDYLSKGKVLFFSHITINQINSLGFINGYH
jgi:hypothetical protein